MSDGVPLQGVSIEWDAGEIGSRRGTFRIHFDSRSEYKARVASLDAGAFFFDNHGQALRLKLRDFDFIEPTSFPSDVALLVFEEPLRGRDPRERMLFGNAFLQGGGWVDVLEFDPPNSEGQDGTLVAHCGDAASYQRLRNFLDEPHGSSLSSLNGQGHWYVNRISDDGNESGPFPQVVHFRLRWLRLE